MTVSQKEKFKTFSAFARHEVLTLTNKSLGDIFGDVSLYAAKNCKEWMAECFAEYMDSANPSEMAKALRDLLESYL